MSLLEEGVIALQALGIFTLLVLFSVLACWKENHILFMINGGLAITTGLFAPDIINGNYETTNMGIAIGLLLITFGFLCWGLSFRLMFWRE
jgi:hypothetical protein